MIFFIIHYGLLAQETVDFSVLNISNYDASFELIIIVLNLYSLYNCICFLHTVVFKYISVKWTVLHFIFTVILLSVAEWCRIILKYDFYYSSFSIFLFFVHKRCHNGNFFMRTDYFNFLFLLNFITMIFKIRYYICLTIKCSKINQNYSLKIYSLLSFHISDFFMVKNWLKVQKFYLYLFINEFFVLRSIFYCRIIFIFSGYPIFKEFWCFWEGTLYLYNYIDCIMLHPEHQLIIFFINFRYYSVKLPCHLTNLLTFFMVSNVFWWLEFDLYLFISEFSRYMKKFKTNFNFTFSFISTLWYNFSKTKFLYESIEFLLDQFLYHSILNHSIKLKFSSKLFILCFIGCLSGESKSWILLSYDTFVCRVTKPDMFVCRVELLDLIVFTTKHKHNFLLNGLNVLTIIITKQSWMKRTQ